MAHIVIVLAVGRDKSPTYDEAFYVTYGYSLWKTCDYRMSMDKPPLAPLLNSIGLLFLDLKSPAQYKEWENVSLWTKKRISSKKDLNPILNARWNLSLDFLYKNIQNPDRMIAFARFTAAILSALFALGVYLCARKLWGNIGGLTALILYVFSPNIISNAALTTEDLAVTGFFFFALFFFWQGFRDTEKADIWLLLSGACSGLALLSKFTAILLFPAFCVIGIMNYRLIKKRKIIRFCLFFTLPLVFTILACYKFIDIKYFYHGWRNMYFLQSIGQQSFLTGEHSSKGFWNYYLIALFVKTPVPTLILVLAGVAALFSKKIKSEYKNKIAILLVPVVIILLAASISKKQIGLRYILPVYPFLFVIASNKKRTYLVTIILGIWYVFSAARMFPDYMAYFNEIAGGPDNGYKILVDSNMDWGQDLKGLKKFINNIDNPPVILSYYGACRPDYVGFPFQDLFSFGIWGENNHILPQNPKQEVLAISATNLQGVYFGAIGRDVFQWLNTREPFKKIGYSIFLYDITHDIDAHRKLSRIYSLTGQKHHADREAKRASALERSRLSGSLSSRGGGSK